MDSADERTSTLDRSDQGEGKKWRRFALNRPQRDVAHVHHWQESAHAASTGNNWYF